MDTVTSKKDPDVATEDVVTSKTVTSKTTTSKYQAVAVTSENITSKIDPSTDVTSTIATIKSVDAETWVNPLNFDVAKSEYGDTYIGS